MSFRSEAIKALVPDANFTMIGDKQILDWDSKEGIPSENDIAVKEQELIEAYKKLKYQRDRADAYPELKEQLDLLWHAINDGKFNVKSKETDFYKKLKAVKDANPKPE